MLKPDQRFMEKALKDENDVYHVDMRAVDPEMVRWLLACLYQGRMPPGLRERLANPETFFDTCHHILGIGLEFGISSFQYVIGHRLNEVMHEQANLFNAYWASLDGQELDEEGSFLANDFAVHFPYLVEAMYTRSLYMVSRPLLCSFFLSTNCRAFQLAPFRDVAQLYPRISYDIYLMVMSETANQQP
ncbi:hypothetical protein ABKA04_009759 [Annulohypoxylon sp. FPYF3050]